VYTNLLNIIYTNPDATISFSFIRVGIDEGNTRIPALHEILFSRNQSEHIREYDTSLVGATRPKEGNIVS
jgi:hypothetical protein